MTGRIFHIDETLKEVCCAIEMAESTMRKHVEKYYHKVNEEFITGLFYGHINYHLCEASRNKRIENAFIQDLKRTIPMEIPRWNIDSELRKRSTGLVADVVLHNRRQEGKTGGDFGLVIVHPQIQITTTSVKPSLEIKKGLSSGLLCQAKLKDKKGKCGVFTKNKKKILPKYLKFTSLVLYAYDNDDRTNLDMIQWKLCKSQTFQGIESLLKNGSLEETYKTSDIIMNLWQEKIGTQCQRLIETIISPSSRQILEIKIYWKGDSKSSESVKVNLAKRMHQQELHLKRGSI